MELAATSGKTSQFPGNDSHVGYTKRCHLLVYPRQALRGRPTTTMPPSPTSLVCQVLYLGTPQTRSFHTLQTSNSNHAPDLAYSGSLVLNHTPDWALRLAKRHRQRTCNGGQHTKHPMCHDPRPPFWLLTRSCLARYVPSGHTPQTKRGARYCPPLCCRKRPKQPGFGYVTALSSTTDLSPFF